MTMADVQTAAARQPAVRSATGRPGVALAMTPIAAGFDRAGSRHIGAVRGSCRASCGCSTCSSPSCLIVRTGLLLRSLRLPRRWSALGQLFALLCLIDRARSPPTASCWSCPARRRCATWPTCWATRRQVVRVEVPPVPASQPILCLVVIAIGLVAVLVDTLTVAAAAPRRVRARAAVRLRRAGRRWRRDAAVVDVPARRGRLRDAAGRRRQPPAPARRNRAKHRRNCGCRGALCARRGRRAALALGRGRGRSPGRHGRAAAVRQRRRRPGAGDALGIQPFTELRGMLDHEGQLASCSRCAGSARTAGYLRALTLATYNSNRAGAARAAPAQGSRPTAQLPLGLGDDGRGVATPDRDRADQLGGQLAARVRHPAQALPAAQGPALRPGRLMVFSVDAQKMPRPTSRKPSWASRRRPTCARPGTDDDRLDPAYLQQAASTRASPRSRAT